MARSGFRRLVIDASVARSAGGPDATFAASKCCRDFLEAVRTICHRVVMTREIVDEWKSHWSNFSRKWRVSMEARKKVDRPANVTNADLRKKLHDLTLNDRQRQTLLKDWHLVEAAIATDQSIISLDEIARLACMATAKSLPQISSIVWVNPAILEEEPIAWLRGGAKAKRTRQLESQAKK